MNFREYKSLSMRTKNVNLNEKENLLNACFGLNGETGEVIDLLKKIIFHKHSFEESKQELKKELGDVCWYLALISDLVDFNCIFFEVEYKNELDIKECAKSLIKVSNRLSIELLRKDINKDKIKKILKRMILEIEYLCFVLKFDFKKVLKLNVEKLIKRYPEGFTSINSIERKGE